jgi:lipoate-protein ligase A
MRWLYVVTPPADGPSNMALDEALMLRAARTGDAVFRVYGFSVPTLSLGRNQRARGCYDLPVAESLGVAFVRRPTGGRALLHDHEVTYSATLPAMTAADARVAYDFINTVLLGGLALLGVGAVRAAAGEAMSPGLRPCFDTPSEHEIAVDGRKLVGSAQWRHGGALLQHGSILVRDDQPLIQRLLLSPSSTTPSAATLEDALGFSPGIDEVAPPMLQSLEELTGRRVASFSLDADTRYDAERLRSTYGDDAWTWRR